MMIRNIGLAIAACAAVSPAVAGQSVQPPSLSACANAFAATMGVHGTRPRYKLTVLNDRDFDSVAWIYAFEYTYDLKALDKRGATIARAMCHATGDGVITSFVVE